ncbi:uncharacterized protein LOC111637125 [Centruroides sculpturatus]|uniref:uncharacterized protein LOC111637125 n=1 Tax=Centruroides sculpturatus TaxID=218467 RepID=UPI000C6C9072|nr:uncharacterized protein LOC111637125 [Centruroides sculpturatus]
MYVTIPSYDTKKSAYACALYTVFIKIVSIGTALYLVCASEDVITKLKNFDGHDLKINKPFYYYSFIHCSFYLLTGIILFVGVKKEKPLFLLIHIWATIIDIAMKFILLTVLINSGITETVPRMLVAFGLLLPLLTILVYEILIVASHYHYLTTRKTKDDQFVMKNKAREN